MNKTRPRGRQVTPFPYQLIILWPSLQATGLFLKLSTAFFCRFETKERVDFFVCPSGPADVSEVIWLNPKHNKACALFSSGKCVSIRFIWYSPFPLSVFYSIQWQNVNKKEVDGNAECYRIRGDVTRSQSTTRWVQEIRDGWRVWVGLGLGLRI